MPRRDQRRRRTLPAIITWVGLSLSLHVMVLGGLYPLWPSLARVESDNEIVPITLMIEMPEEQAEEEEEEKDPEVDGQIVETAKPIEEKIPEEAEYLAEHNNVVEKETRTERFRINPEVIAPTYSPDDKMQFEDLMDLKVTDPSTGATVGNDRFDPDRNGSLAALPSPFTLTNKEGLQRPVPASHSSQDLSGAPNNDLVDEERGAALNLNTNAILYASYINRIKRLVNFYWNQNIDNLPRSLMLSKPRYDTVVFVVLDGNGVLESIQVTTPSGITALDNAVVEAFRIAGPFPNPPEQLIAKDGRAYLPDMGFVVQQGQARSPYQGVDPRQHVQYPGILKATH